MIVILTSQARTHEGNIFIFISHIILAYQPVAVAMIHSLAIPYSHTISGFADVC